MSTDATGATELDVTANSFDGLVLSQAGKDCGWSEYRGLMMRACVQQNTAFA